MVLMAMVTNVVMLALAFFCPEPNVKGCCLLYSRSAVSLLAADVSERCAALHVGAPCDAATAAHSDRRAAIAASCCMILSVCGADFCDRVDVPLIFITFYFGRSLAP